MNIMVTLFHVTPARNLTSIAVSGIDPIFSEGKLPVCWYVAESGLVWAFAHVAARRDLKLSELVALSVAIPESELRRTRWTDVFTSRTAHHFTNAYSVERALRDHEYALATAEKNAKRLRKPERDPLK